MLRLTRAAALVVTGALAGALAAQPADARVLLSAKLLPKERGRAIPRSFLGFSAEWNTVWRETGTDVTGVNPVYAGLMRTLASYGGGVPTLRIGGNYQDSAWWNPGNLQPAYERGIFVNIRPGLLRGVAASLAETGQRATLGINLAANDPALAAAEADGFTQFIPRSAIRGFEIGNEPDFYVNRIQYQKTDANGKVLVRRYARTRGFNGPAYLRQWERVARAVRRTAPKVPLVGTGGYGVIVKPKTFVRRERRHLAYYSEHAYPLAGCSPHGRVYRPGDKQYPTLAKLLGAPGLTTTIGQQKQGVAAAHRYHKPYVVDEMNSVSCATRQELSASYATALWGIDHLFMQVSLGVDGVNIHIGGDPKAPFRFGLQGPQSWVGSVDPLFYALLTFARASGHSGRLLLFPTYTARTKANAHIWVMRSGKKLRVVVVNKDLRRAGTVRFTVPGSQRGARLARLTAPSLTARTGITLGGQSIATPTYDGALQGSPVESAIRPKRGVYSFTLPRASAALLTIG